MNKNRAMNTILLTSPKVVVVATWNKYGMRSHAGAWERGKKYRLNLVPTLLRGNAYLRDEHFLPAVLKKLPILL